MNKIWVLLIFIVGCGEKLTPPDQYYIDPTFTLEEAVVIRDAVGAWCDSVGWCPEEVRDKKISRGRFEKQSNYFRWEEEPDYIAYNDGNNVYLNPNHPDIDDLNMLWTAVAHEIGHWGIRDHTSSGLMSEERISGQYSLDVDQQAIDAWHHDTN